MNHHVIVRNREISIVGPVMVQSNVAVDTVTVSVDSEYDGLQVALVIGGTQLMYDGEPVTVPSSELERAGDLPLTVLGLSSGKRVVTASAEAAFRVVASGAFEGEDPVSDSPDMLQQLADAYKAANEAAGTATEAARAAQDAVAKVDEAVSDLGDAAANAAAARESAEAAAKSASDAGASESSARASAESASSDADSASSSATTARQSATEAASSATGASQSATEAKASAESASESASFASADARTASQSASTAESAASSAGDAAAAAQSSAGTAQDVATIAQEDASTAQTAAETATAQAQAASSSASAAAQSATDAKASADLAAGWVPADGEPGQILTKTEDGTTWRDAPSGNVLTGTATGPVAHADDAYAAKPREVRIDGRTVKNLWPVVEGTIDGLTFATDETGLITVSGTATASGHIKAMVSGLAENKNISAVKSGGALSVSLQAWKSGSYVQDIMTVDTSASTANTGTGFDTIYARINYMNGETYNTPFRVMLVEGTEAPDCFTPTGVHGVEAGELVVAGRNLNDVAQQIERVGWSSSTETGWFDTRAELLALFNALPEGEYALSCKCHVESVGPESTGDPSAHDLAGFIVRASGNILKPCTSRMVVGVAQIGDVLEIFQMVKISPETYMGQYDQLYVYSPGIDSGYKSISTFYDIQLELGSTTTDYESPSVTDVALPETDPLMDGDALTIAQDGAVTASRSDGTAEQLGTVQTPTLPAPTFNAYATGGYVPPDTSVEYERDINIVLANLESVQAALLGGE